MQRKKLFRKKWNRKLHLKIELNTKFTELNSFQMKKKLLKFTNLRI